MYTAFQARPVPHEHNPEHPRPRPAAAIPQWISRSRPIPLGTAHRRVVRPKPAHMNARRTLLEAEFMRLCAARGPAWIESVVRPLRLPGVRIAARDIPENALRSIVSVFGHPARSLSSVTAR